MTRQRRTFDSGAKPSGLFVPGGEIKEKIWHPFAPVWGTVIKCGMASQFDEVTYGQMLDDAVARNLRIFMDQDHASAHACWSMTHVEVPSLAYYCGLQVNHLGKLWRRENLAGHSCADALPLDPTAQPEGLAGFLCNVTPKGREVLANYQALSIDFNPFGSDHEGHSVGQVLNCVSAVNGPHLPGAGPAGGRFNRDKRYFDMNTKKRKVYALAKDAGEGEPETKDLSAEMAELAKVLGMPEGSAPESIIGAALAVIKAGQHEEPDGDEGFEATDGEGALAADPALPGAMKYAEDMPPEEKKYARAAAVRFSRRGRLVGLLAKELGSGAKPKALLSAVVKLKEGQSEFGAVKGRLDVLEAEKTAREKADAEAKALARETEIKKILDMAGPVNLGGTGRISEAKATELFDKAKRLGMTADDVRSWLPEGATTLTANGKPNGSGGGAGGGGSDRVVGGEIAARIAGLRDQYQKESGKRLLYDQAGAIVASLARGGGTYSYEKAKEQADRLPPSAFVKGAK